MRREGRAGPGGVWVAPGEVVSESLRPALVPACSWHTWSVPGRQSPWEPFSISARASCSTRPPHPPFPASSQRKSSVALAGSFLPTEGPSRFPQPPDILASPPSSHQSRGLTGQPRRYPFPPSRLAQPPSLCATDHLGGPHGSFFGVGWSCEGRSPRWKALVSVEGKAL